MSTRENDSEARFLCRHILANGHRCRSACLRNEEFCYYHHASRKPVANPGERKGRRSTFTLPRIEDRASVQAALNELIARIAANDIDSRRAGRLLYALQIASSNLPRPAALTDSGSRDDQAPGQVEEVVQHPTYGEIAPRSALSAPPERKSLARQLREEMEALEARNIAEFGACAEESDQSDESFPSSNPNTPPHTPPAGPPVSSTPAPARHVNFFDLRDFLGPEDSDDLVRFADSLDSLDPLDPLTTEICREVEALFHSYLYGDTSSPPPPNPAPHGPDPHDSARLADLERQLADARAELEALKAATQPPATTQPETIPTIQAVAEPAPHHPIRRPSTFVILRGTRRICRVPHISTLRCGHRAKARPFLSLQIRHSERSATRAVEEPRDPSHRLDRPNPSATKRVPHSSRLCLSR